MNKSVHTILLIVTLLVMACGGGAGKKSSLYGNYEGSYRTSIVVAENNCSGTGDPSIIGTMDVAQDNNVINVMFMDRSFNGTSSQDEFVTTTIWQFQNNQIKCEYDVTLKGQSLEPKDYNNLKVTMSIDIKRCNRPVRGCRIVYKGTAVKSKNKIAVDTNLNLALFPND